jgi:hypothetical protein
LFRAHDAQEIFRFLGATDGIFAPQNVFKVIAYTYLTNSPILGQLFYLQQNAKKNLMQQLWISFLQPGTLVLATF